MIVGDDQLDVARVLVAEGASVVVVAPAPGVDGEAVVEIEAGPSRLVVFVGDLADPSDRASLCELIDELFARDA